MKMSCDVIRDLLPLYADDACSGESRRMVEEHLQECGSCADMLRKLRSDEIEEDLRTEKQDVISYGKQQFRRRSATVGSTVSGMFMIPIVALLILNLLTGSALNWLFIVLASLAVAASLIVVPLMVPRDKAFWTFCAFCASLMVLLGVTCLASGGNWFWVAASSSLFGLGLIFLPFVVRAKPLQKWIGNTRKGLLVLGVDAALFLNMMSAINMHNSATGSLEFSAIGCMAGVALVALGVIRNGGKNK